MPLKKKASKAKLHIFSSKKDIGKVELLTAVAYYHHTCSIQLHDTLNFGRSCQGSSLCQYGFVSLPYLDGPQLENLFFLESKTIKFYWLIPVTKSEVNYKARRGFPRIGGAL